MIVDNLIVTGGLGFIGKNFCERICGNYKNKYIIDRGTYASDLDFYYRILKGAGWELIIADVNEIGEISRIRGLENMLIVNFAAESHVDHSFSNANHFMKANALGTLSVLDFCRETNARLIHISTDEIYGEVIGNPATEDSLLNPSNPYSATKAAADLLAQTYARCFNVDVKTIRANNVFGSGQLSEKVIPKAVEYASLGKKFEIHGQKDLRRHFLHTSDFTSAIVCIIDTWDECEHRIFNIAGNESYLIRELVCRIYEHLGVSQDLVINGEDRAFNDTEYSINDDRLRGLGWAPKVDFWKAIRSICDERSYFLGR